MWGMGTGACVTQGCHVPSPHCWHWTCLSLLSPVKPSHQGELTPKGHGVSFPPQQVHWQEGRMLIQWVWCPSSSECSCWSPRWAGDWRVRPQQLLSWMEGAGNNPAASRAIRLLTCLHLPLGKCFPAGSWSGCVHYWSASTWLLEELPDTGQAVCLRLGNTNRALFDISREHWDAAQAEEFIPVLKSIWIWSEVNLNFATS